MTYVLACGVCSKDGDFGDEVRAFVGIDRDLLSENAASHFREKVAAALDSWSVENSDEVADYARQIRECRTLDELATLATAAYESVTEEGEYWSVEVYEHWLELQDGHEDEMLELVQ